MAQLNIKVPLKSYPYLNPALSVLSTGRTGESGTSPGAEAALDQIISSLQQGLPTITFGTTPTTGQDKWKSAALTGFDGVSLLVTNLGKAVDGINKLVTILSKVLQIVEMFISTFSSFSGIVKAIITYGEQTLVNFAKDLKGGVYANAICPPAFYAKYADDPNYIQQSRGGFQGFITRLEASINNTQDPNRPNFSPDAEVGGMVILVDTESIDQLWIALKQLAAVFDFVKLFGLNLTPPPPKGLRGRCGYFPLQGFTTEEKQFGIRLQWSMTPMTTNYYVYRSAVPGGTLVEQEVVPSSLMDDSETGEAGLFTIAKEMIFNGKTTLPTKLTTVYNDPTFNNGQPVKVSNQFDTTISFIDTFVDENVQQYFYVVRSSPTAQNSVELPVIVKKCNDLINMASVIPQPLGHFEFLSMGAGALNSWTSIQVSLAVPWVNELVALIIKNFLEPLRGMVNNASDSFTSFLNQIVDKIQGYVSILKAVTLVIDTLKGFLIGQSISFLELPPAKGGTENFVQRIQTARLPEGQTAFSGPDGISIGVVIMYAGNQALAAAISFIMSLFVKK